jgi:hypothetical protein
VQSTPGPPALLYMRRAEHAWAEPEPQLEIDSSLDVIAG